jgi:hypothetical protein
MKDDDDHDIIDSKSALYLSSTTTSDAPSVMVESSINASHHGSSSGLYENSHLSGKGLELYVAAKERLRESVKA